jgi:hypothetical protein
MEENKDLFDDYLNLPGSLDIFNPKAVKERIDEARKKEREALDRGDPTCNFTTTAMNATYGISTILSYIDENGKLVERVAKNLISDIRENDKLFKDITGSNLKETFKTAYDTAVADKERTVYALIEPKKPDDPWHIAIVNPNASMKISGNYNMEVPQLYSYVPTKKKVGTEHFGWHADPKEVKSIQFFQYIGVVIESNIEERWKEIGGKK